MPEVPVDLGGNMLLELINKKKIVAYVTNDIDNMVKTIKIECAQVVMPSYGLSSTRCSEGCHTPH